MPARFLLGPAGSGKTFRCLAEIRAALQKNPDGAPLIFLAPKQATFQLERQLLADDSPAGYTRLHIFSFERLARFVLDELGLAPPKFLSDEGRVMVLRALLLRHADELKLFRQSARRPGFAQELEKLLNELQQHQLTPAGLRAVAQNKNLRAGLREKLDDLALLSEKYAGWLHGHELHDGSHLLDFAAAAMRNQFKIQNSKFKMEGLWLDGFAEMTPQELDLLAAVVPACERATLAFCLGESAAKDAETSWLSIWNAVGKSFQQCRQRIESLPDAKIEILPRDLIKNRFAKNPELAGLEASWSQPTQNSKPKTQNSVRLVSCPNAEAEAVFAAREILKFVRAGNRFRDCAVLVRNLDGYHKPLAREFRRYGIPFFLDRRESVAHHPLAELTRSALRTVAFDWRSDDWFAALKAGFSPAKEDAIDALENAALEFGWRGKKWREPLPDEPSERLRQILLPPFEKFSARLAKTGFKPNGPRLADALRKLWNDLKARETLDRWMLDDKKSAIRHPPSAIHQTVRDQMDLWLENLELAFSNEPLPLRDWLPVLEAGLGNLTVGVIPPALDEVLIGAIDRARNPDLKLALILGVNETVFPATPAAQTILTDADRDELAVPLGPDLREQISRERFYGYIACTRASEQLIVTCSRHDAGGKTLNPSPFIAHLQGIFPALKIEEFQSQIDLADAQHVSELAPFILIQTPHPDLLPVWWGEGEKSSDAPQHAFSPPKRGEGGRRPDAGNDNLNELLKISVLAKLKKTLDGLRELAATENLSPALAEKLYGPVLRSSVSRLEEFAQCPFRFFVRSGLRADERKVFELDARERGSFQHDVLKIFHDELMAEGKRWRALEPAEARERIGKIAAAQTEHFRDGLFRDSAETIYAARTLAESLQDFVAVIVTWLRGQNDFDPAAAELEFDDKPGARAPAWEIDLGGGHKMSLHGRIDRVDLWRESLRTATDEALAMVIDYKSSQKKLDAVLVEHGIQLQLLAYLNVLRHWKNPQEVFGVKRLIPAGVFYVNLRGEYKGGGTRTEILAEADESRRRAYRHTGRFDAGVLDRLDRVRAKDQFAYQLKNNGELYANSTEALPRADFEKLLNRVETQLGDMGKRIFSGAAEVAPYRKGKDTPCEFCDYQAVCRIDPWTHEWRILRKNESASASPA